MNSIEHYARKAAECEINDLHQLETNCQLVSLCCLAIHHLQKERGGSTIFLGSHRQQFIEQLADYVEKTDHAIEQLTIWIETHSESIESRGVSRFYLAIAQWILQKHRLSRLRLAIQKETLSAKEATQTYTQVIASLLNLVFEAVDLSTNPAISKLLLSLFLLMQGKEASGLERALGSRIITSGEKIQSELVSLEKYIETQKECIDKFKIFTTEDSLRHLILIEGSSFVLEILQFRSRIMNLSNFPKIDEAKRWFDFCTKKIDALHQLELNLLNQLNTKCQELLEEKKQRFVDISSELDINTLNESVEYLSTMPTHAIRGLVELLNQQKIELNALKSELSKVRLSLTERKVIERAKGILMDLHSLSEEDAYTLLRKEAMSRGQRIIDLARALIASSTILSQMKR